MSPLDTPLKRALRGDRTVMRSNGSPLVVTRSMTLDDIVIRSKAQGGDGRTVDAYAAVFNTPAEIKDSDGHYREQNDPSAFNRSIAERAGQIFCIYNHGRSLGGTPSDMWSVPLGVPLSIKADGHGLLTSTRFNTDPESERILEAIKSGSLRGMSYTGVFVRSHPALDGPHDSYQPSRGGELTLVTRQEIALIEYGPTPIPAFSEAQVTGVRSHSGEREPERERIEIHLHGLGGPVHAGDDSPSRYDGPVQRAKQKDPADGVSEDLQGQRPLTISGLHKAGVVMHKPYDATAATYKMKFPASAAQMQSLYTMYDTTGNGAAANEYAREHGQLPHHEVSIDGVPGPANLDGVKWAMGALHGARVSPDDRVAAMRHLEAHMDEANDPDGPVPITDHFGGPMVGTYPNPQISSSGRGDDDERDRAWDAGEVMAAAGQAADPGAAFSAVCAGRRSGDPDTESGWALPHHREPGGPADPDAVAAALAQLADTTGLVNVQAVRSHLQAHLREFEPVDDAAGRKKHGNDNGSNGGDGKKDKKDGKDGGAGKQPMGGSDGDDDDDDQGDRAGKGAEGDGSKPYGNVTYADPGYQKDKKKRYPIDTKDHVKAAWSYINQSKNAGAYSSSQLASIKSKIKGAAKKFGVEISDDSGGKSGNTSSSGRNPAAATPRAGTGTAATTAPVYADPHRIRPVPRYGETMEGTETEGRMTIDERTARQAEVRARLAEIDTHFMGAELPGEARTEWRQLQEELVVHERAIADAAARRDYLQSIADGMPEGATETTGNLGYDRPPPNQYPEQGNGYLPPRRAQYLPPRGENPWAPRSTTFYNPDRNIYDLTAIRQRARSFDELPTLYREYAMRAVDEGRFSTPVKNREDCQESVARLLEHVDDPQGTLARRVLSTGSPVYDRAFGKVLQTLSTAGLSGEESRALQLGVDSFGGYAVPFQLDPTVILASNGAINPLRAISRVEQIVGKEWDGVTSAGVTVTRVAEGTEAGTGDPQLIQPNVRTTRVQGFVPFNIELDVSWGALRSQMTNLLMDAKDIEEASSFTTGSGTAPQAAGVVNTLYGQAQLQVPIPTVVIQTAGTATLSIGDLYAVENSMAPRFRQQSAYLASKTTFNRFRQLFQALASAAFDSWVRPSAGTPATFNGYPAYEASSMASTITSGSNVLLQGDFKQFLIVDRVGMGIELIPHLFGASNRYPVGQRGILAIWFNNSKILVPNAFRLLQTL